MTFASPELDFKRINRAIAYACRLLGNREYSRKLIYQKVMTRGYSESETRQVIDYLLENNWLSDERFCESFIRSKANRGQGILRVMSELGQKGISKSVIERILDELSIDWQANCDVACAKKLTQLGDLDLYELRIKLQRFLTYRGFTSDQVQLSFKKLLN